MPVLRDFVCPCCGQLREDVIADVCTCECGTQMVIVCNGGLKSRWRFADFPRDPDFYKGQVKLGDVMIDDKVVQSADDPARVEKLDRLHFDRRKQRGKATLTFDQKE